MTVLEDGSRLLARHTLRRHRMGLMAYKRRMQWTAPERPIPAHGDEYRVFGTSMAKVTERHFDSTSLTQAS